MLVGHSTWQFPSKPVIVSTGVVGGPFEGKGNLSDSFDILYDNIWMDQKSFEKAEKLMLEDACQKALDKAGVKKQDVNFFIGGDLMNQIISSSFAARTLEIPYVGIFGACSTSMLGLAVAAQFVESGAARYAITGTSSHNSSVEKQFRYPTEYGGQKPPTAQWTVTGAGAALVAPEGDGPRVTKATIGRIVDMGLKDPFNMGSAMAPAAAETIQAHFRETGLDPSHYDVIATGDLGRVGHKICADLLAESGTPLPEDQFTDCGTLIYREDQPVFAGASGCASAAVVTYGHFMEWLKTGKVKRILVVATGALLSPLSYQQKESIPCIAHAVSIEMD
ncbi:stage V sporulation protein AD [Desulfitispora alkaliphila]|uniref:stage V sporulation protein AD n=1 Tax=Desulfitispora alkaliphila TaxID=622674 RepID=UPI003D1F6482